MFPGTQTQFQGAEPTSSGSSSIAWASTCASRTAGDDIKKLTMPTMLVWGDSDMIRLEHIIEFYKELGGGQRDAGWQREHMSKNRLAILPNRTHYEMAVAPELVPTVLPFLDGKTGAP